MATFALGVRLKLDYLDDDIENETPSQRRSRCESELLAMLSATPMVMADITARIDVSSKIKKDKFVSNLLQRSKAQGKVVLHEGYWRVNPAYQTDAHDSGPRLIDPDLPAGARLQPWAQAAVARATGDEPAKEADNDITDDVDDEAPIYTHEPVEKPKAFFETNDAELAEDLKNAEIDRATLQLIMQRLRIQADNEVKAREKLTMALADAERRVRSLETTLAVLNQMANSLKDDQNKS